MGPSVLGATAAPGGGGGPLPFTGLELLRLLAVALGLIVLGVALRSLGRWADRRSSGVDQ